MWLFSDKRRPPCNSYIYTPTTGLTGVLKLVRTFFRKMGNIQAHESDERVGKVLLTCYSRKGMNVRKIRSGIWKTVGSFLHVSSFAMQISLFFLSRDLNSLSSGKCGCQQFPGFMDNGSTDLRETAVGSDLKRDLSSLSRSWTWVAWVKTRNPSH